MIFVLHFLVNIWLADSIEIDCNYELNTWPSLGYHYVCFVKNVRNTTINEVTSVDGTHIEGYSNDDVKALNWQLHAVATIPSNFSAFFPNLRGVQFLQAGLQRISSNDLKQFPNLRLLAISRNRLTRLDGKLFQETPNLNWIKFQYNSLRNVSQYLLDDLKDLELADFRNSGCLDFEAQNLNDFEELKRLLPINCPLNGEPVRITTTTEIPATECSSSCLDLRLENQKLREQLLSIEKTANDRFSEIEKQLRQLNSRAG